LIDLALKEIDQVHCMERMDELEEKKETFRKVINLVH